MARIKGLKKKDFINNKNLIMKTLDLEEFANIKA